jgi:hypothetical protein
VAKLITAYWRDIPVQVVAKKGRETAKAGLTQRFMAAVDRAAMRAKKASADAYLSEWRRVSRTVSCDDLQAQADAEARQLEAAYTDEDLDRLARAGGVNSS